MQSRTVAVVFCLLALSVASFARDRDFQTAKLVNVSYDEVLRSGSSQRHAVYKVRLEATIYSAEGSKMHHPTDPGHGLVIGDQVRVAIEGEHMFLRRPDGKDIKATIVKRQREEGLLARWFGK
jgi:hypothetical protein